MVDILGTYLKEESSARIPAEGGNQHVTNGKLSHQESLLFPAKKSREGNKERRAGR